MWKSISGFEGVYEVSDTGIVRSLDRHVEKSNGVVQHRRGREKAQTENKDGYMTVKLSIGGNDVRVPVHTLVARAFVDGWFDGAEVNHKDFNRKNNNACNLEWVTHSDNVRYTIGARRHFCNTDMSGKNNPNYGNHKLAERYAADRVLSIEKNSRPGARNGRATPIRAYLTNENYIDFEYILDCARYLVKNGYTRSKSPESVLSRISAAARSGKYAYGLRYSLI